jgi:hypothetical protein
MFLRPKSVVVCCWVMAPIVALAAMTADTAGMLTSSGTVRVDDQPASGRTAVFPGSRIETSPHSQAVVTGSGLVISLAESSNLVYGKSALDLQSGVVVIASSTGVTARAQDATISTAAGVPSRFIAKRVGDELLVAALEGSVFVSQDQEGGAIPPNKGVHVKLKKKKAGAADPGEKRVGWLHNDDLGLLLVVAAGVTAGVALGIANSGGSKPATPSGP